MAWEEYKERQVLYVRLHDTQAKEQVNPVKLFKWAPIILYLAKSFFSFPLQDYGAACTVCTVYRTTKDKCKICNKNTINTQHID